MTDPQLPGWRHPGTHRAPRRVIVCALGPTRADYIDLQTKHEADLLDIDEVWGVNVGANWLSGRVRFDLLWVMDYLDGEAAAHPGYGAQLRAWAKSQDRLIMTSVAGSFSDVAVEYPLAAIWKAARAVNPNAGPYFCNSLPYILAYAWAIGVEELILFGVDYSHPTMGLAFEANRANCEYWIGWVRARGVAVGVPTSSTILSSSAGEGLYGYPPGPDRAVSIDGDDVRVPGSVFVPRAVGEGWD
jgi:hypothetical protein